MKPHGPPLSKRGAGRARAGSSLQGQLAPIKRNCYRLRSAQAALHKPWKRSFNRKLKLPHSCTTAQRWHWRFPSPSHLCVFNPAPSAPSRPVCSSALPNSCLIFYYQRFPVTQVFASFLSQALPPQKYRVKLTPPLWLRWELLHKHDQEPSRLAGRHVQGWEGGTGSLVHNRTAKRIRDSQGGGRTSQHSGC